VPAQWRACAGGEQQLGAASWHRQDATPPDRIAYYPGPHRLLPRPADGACCVPAVAACATDGGHSARRATATAYGYGLRLWSTAMAFDAGMITSYSAKWLQSGEHERARLQAG
jgi:hypothetical protein